MKNPKSERKPDIRQLYVAKRLIMYAAAEIVLQKSQKLAGLRPEQAKKYEKPVKGEYI